VPAWRVELGRPRGAPSQSRPVWRREFTNGIVLVNPSSSATVSVPLGAPYLQPNGSVVTSVLLGPHTGLTLRNL
jgi:hypothetical protein